MWSWVCSQWACSSHDQAVLVGGFEFHAVGIFRNHFEHDPVAGNRQGRHGQGAQIADGVASERYPGLAAKEPTKNDRAIINKQIQIHFTPGSDEIMPGSFFVLDSLGETMTSFGNTYLRIEGNTDSTGSPTGNMTLSERRALAVKNYVLQNFPGITASRFQTIGHGASNPVAGNETEGGRQLNRRTDIKVVLATG